MKKNVGSADKIIRIIIAIAAAYFAYTGAVSSPWNYVLYVVAGIMAVSTVAGCCPLYSILGIGTCKVKEQ